MPTETRSVLTAIRARDAMHAPIVAVGPGADLRHVAGLMGRRRIHAVLVEGIVRDHLVWRVVTDRDLLAAVRDKDASISAASIAATEATTVDADDDLGVVCDVLAAHDCTHVIVVEGGRPVGIISTLDIASAIGD